MFLHRSHRTEELATALAEVVRKPLASAMTQEIVVVSSQGMERWLAQDLASRLGVWANARFPFPRAFVDELLFATDGAMPEHFSRETSFWSIASLLPRIAENEGAAAVKSYLTHDEHGLKRFDLSRKIADTFDQYAVYRPELVRAWERGAGRGWQPDLWRALVALHGPLHVAARAERFLDGPLPEGVPERVSVFGASSLPRIYLKILARLARDREVHLFLLSPSPNTELPHPLAASLGRLGRDFEQLVHEECRDTTVRDRFAPPGGRTLLEGVQSDLRGRPTSSAARKIPRDDSITVHACHSPLREVEILRDQLLSAFDADPSLEPHDVIVMAPDIDTYAPLIDAVFGFDPGEPGFIPYRVSDRKVRALSAVADAVIRVLDLAGSRMKASDVLDLLEIEPVRHQFGIDAEALPELRRMVKDSGIRWGMDAAHRTSLGQPASDDHTWRFGLDRLILGYAMGAADTLFRGVSPLPPRADDEALIGKLAEVVSTLFAWQRRLSAPRTVGDWSAALEGLLAAFVSDEEPHFSAARPVTQAIASLAERATLGNFHELLHREALLAILRSELDRERVSRNFLTGGVTFCALLPMRSVPFRVVCLLGLHDTTFPRTDYAPAFDLVAESPELGDRSSREEDRQLFLEALLSARDRFVISYVGRAVQDNSPFPPSVVVAELLDAIDGTSAKKPARPGQLSLFGTDPDAPDPPSRHIVIEHPLQAFSQRYFGADPDPRLVSFAEADAAGARALASREMKRPGFQAGPLLDAAVTALSVDDLVRFLENPSRGLIQRRLGVVLDEDVTVFSDRAPIVLGPLDKYEMGTLIFEELRKGREPARVREWARGLGFLPSGAPGDVDLAEVFEDAHALYERTRAWCDGGRLEAVEIDAEVNGTRLFGVLRDVYPGGQAFARYARMKARTELAAWVRHLSLCISEREPRTTAVLGRPPYAVAQRGRARAADAADAPARTHARIFDPVDSKTALRHLAELVRLYKLGQRAPLCLFPEASRRYVEKLRDAEPTTDAREAARAALDAARETYAPRRGTGIGADADDAYVRRIFEHEAPFDPVNVPFDPSGALELPGFADLAQTVFEPLLAASRFEAT